MYILDLHMYMDIFSELFGVKNEVFELLKTKGTCGNRASGSI